MSNRRETAEARIFRMQRNSEAVFDKDSETVTPEKRYKAWKRNRRAERMLLNLRERQQTAFYNNMLKENTNG